MKFNRVQYFYATTVINSLCYNITEIFCSFAFPRSTIILTFHNKKKMHNFWKIHRFYLHIWNNDGAIKAKNFPNSSQRGSQTRLLSPLDAWKARVENCERGFKKKKRRPVAILIHVSSSVIDVFNRFGRLDEVSVIFIHGSR